MNSVGFLVIFVSLVVTTFIYAWGVRRDSRRKLEEIRCFVGRAMKVRAKGDEKMVKEDEK